MGEAYELATELAAIAMMEGKTFILVARKDGTFQMTMADPENDGVPERTGRAHRRENWQHALNHNTHIHHSTRRGV